LAERYAKPLDGHLETLKDRVHAYLETLVRAKNNKALLAGYHDAAENRNVVQLVKGGTQNRDRYFLGFNTPADLARDCGIVRETCQNILSDLKEGGIRDGRQLRQTRIRFDLLAALAIEAEIRDATQSTT
jgi:hypothetical protein